MGVSGWVGASFPPRVSVMWLLSSGSSFLASFLCWEPLKVTRVWGASPPASGCRGPPLTPALAQVLLEALYFSLVAKRLHPDEDDTLVESPAVTPVSERVPRVRPPHGFALFLAKEEARKVKRLHGMLQVSSVPALVPGLPSRPQCALLLSTEGPSAGGLGLCGLRPSCDLFLPSLVGVASWPWQTLCAHRPGSQHQPPWLWALGCPVCESHALSQAVPMGHQAGFG